MRTKVLVPSPWSGGGGRGGTQLWSAMSHCTKFFARESVSKGGALTRLQEMSPDGDWNCAEKTAAKMVPSRPSPRRLPCTPPQSHPDIAPNGHVSVGAVTGLAAVASLSSHSLPTLDGVDHTFIDVGDGVTIHVADAGPAEGPPVMLVHGFPENWWARSEDARYPQRS
jgi:hypothetical protein